MREPREIHQNSMDFRREWECQPCDSRSIGYPFFSEGGMREEAMCEAEVGMRGPNSGGRGEIKRRDKRNR